MKKLKILVIGAGGQLGSELTEALRGRYGDSHVIASDIKDPGGSVSMGNFEILDVLDKPRLFEFIEKNGINQIYHLAAVLSATGERNPGMAWKLNMDGLIHVLDAAVKKKVNRIYWPSSIAVFGPNTPKDSTPQDAVTDPTTIYGISKVAGEQWCRWYFRKYGIDVRSLRYPGLIGYKSRPGGGTTDYAVEIFFKALLEKSYTCFLKPDTYLPMMYMDDAIKATMDLMEAPAERISVRLSYNVASMSFCPAEIVDVIKRRIPDFRVTYAPDFRQTIADTWPHSVDDSQARTDWNWKPEYDLKQMTDEILDKLPVILQSHAGPTG